MRVSNSTTPPPAEEETWMGIARGRYEGNSLVINLSNFNAYTWFDMAGNYHSNELKVVERYTPINADALQYEATITEPKTFTRPWTIRVAQRRMADEEFWEWACHEGERDSHHSSSRITEPGTGEK